MGVVSRENENGFDCVIFKYGLQFIAGSLEAKLSSCVLCPGAVPTDKSAKIVVLRSGQSGQVYASGKFTMADNCNRDRRGLRPDERSRNLWFPKNAPCIYGPSEISVEPERTGPYRFI